MSSYVCVKENKAKSLFTLVERIMFLLFSGGEGGGGKGKGGIGVAAERQSIKTEYVNVLKKKRLTDAGTEESEIKKM